MRSVERAPGVRVGDRVVFWVSHPLDDAQHWQEGVVSRIVRYPDDHLLEIDSFTPQPIYRWLSEVMRGVPEA